MSNPPALPEPIKPPNGDFSLEERKWREGVTRAINNLSAGKEDAFTKGNLSGDSSYINVSGGTEAVIGSGVTLSFNASNLPKLNASNAFTGSNTFSSGLSANAITLNGSDLATTLSNKADAFTKGNLSGDGTYIGVTNGTNAVIGSGTSLTFTDTNLAKLNASNTFTGATNTFKALSVGGDITPSANNSYAIGNSSYGFKSLHFGHNNAQHASNGDYGIFSDKGYLELAGLGGSNGGVIIYGLSKLELFTLTGAGLVPKGTVTSNVSNLPCGLASNHWSYVYTNNLTLGNCAIYHAGSTNDLQIGWNSSGARAVYFKGLDVYPYTSNTINLGNSNGRWKKVYSNSGSIDTSDKRAKSNIEPLDNSLKTLNSLKIYSFTMNGDEDHIQYGILAQDELEKAPELIYVPDDYDTKSEKSGLLGIHTNNVLYTAVRAIQELSDKVKQLEGAWK